MNPESVGYLRGLESEFGESSNAIRLELNRFERAGMLLSFYGGNKKLYKANKQHPLFKELRGIIMKHVGIDKIVDQVIDRLGDLKEVYLTGDYAMGKDSGVIDLIFVGKIEKTYLLELIEKVEGMISRKIKYIVYAPEEFDPGKLDPKGSILIWNHEK